MSEFSLATIMPVFHHPLLYIEIDIWKDGERKKKERERKKESFGARSHESDGTLLGHVGSWLLFGCCGCYHHHPPFSTPFELNL